MKINKKIILSTIITLLISFCFYLCFYIYSLTNLNNLKHKSFLINVDKETLRLEHMKQRFSEANVDFERFSASTPKSVTLEYKDSSTGEIKKITAEQVSEIKEWKNVKVSCSENNEFHISSKHWGVESKVWPGQLGCWCSHRLLWQKILDDNLDYAIIFEDDAVFAKKFKSKLSLMMAALPSDYEMLILHDHIAYDKWYKKQFMFYPDPFIRRYNGWGFWGTEGYVVSNKGARALLEITKLSDRPVDNQMELLMKNGNTYMPRFIVPIEGQNSVEGSTIIPVQKTQN